MKVLMLASFGLEIVECGGALALAQERGDDVEALVLICRQESQPQVRSASEKLGISEVSFLGVDAGEVPLEGELKNQIVGHLRRVQPDVVVLQDPEHAQHDFDPARRTIALLLSECLAIAPREWRIDECGGYQPSSLPEIYYMSPSRPNCVVEIQSVLAQKIEAVAELGGQHEFSAKHWVERAGRSVLEDLFGDWGDDLAILGEKGQKALFRALALSQGLGSHSNVVLGESYRKEGLFVLKQLN